MELIQLDRCLEKIVQDFVELLKVKLSVNLKAALLYGSAARGAYSKRYSDINILLVVEALDRHSLKSIGALKRRLAFNKIAVLALSKKDIKSSTDTFPIEFLDMKENHILLWGEDYLKGLTIDLKNLRHQCEWELKSKLIQAQQLYINSFMHKNALRIFLLKNLPSFITVFKNILRLQGISESSKDKILERIALEFGLHTDIFRQLWQMRQGSLKTVAIEEAFERFLEALSQLSYKVDTLLVNRG